MFNEVKQKIKLPIFITMISLASLVLVGCSGGNNFDAETMFVGKSDAQVKMELLEFENYLYEETPLKTIKTDDYQFDIYRVIEDESSPLYGFYIVGSEFSVYTAANGSDYISTGTVDFQIYEADSSGNYTKIISDTRLDVISGTDNVVMQAYLEFTPNDSKDYAIVVDCSRAEEAFGVDELAVIHLNELYDVDIIRSAELLQTEIEMKKGFSGDIGDAVDAGLFG